MKVLIAGATGVVGRPLVRMLTGGGHEAYALTRSPRTVPGATTVVADALDRTALLAAVDGLALDAVVHQLTALKKVPTREGLMAATNRLRSEGTANLLAVARATGARRFVTQSFYAGYGVGDHGPEHSPRTRRSAGRAAASPLRWPLCARRSSRSSPRRGSRGCRCGTAASTGPGRSSR